MFRYTIKELGEFSDYEMLRCIVLDRRDTTKNNYSPLNKRLGQLYDKLVKREELSK